MGKSCTGCGLPVEALEGFDKCLVCLSVWCGDCVSVNPRLGRICRECGNHLGDDDGGDVQGCSKMTFRDALKLPWANIPEKSSKDEGAPDG